MSRRRASPSRRSAGGLGPEPPGDAEPEPVLEAEVVPEPELEPPPVWAEPPRGGPDAGAGARSRGRGPDRARGGAGARFDGAARGGRRAGAGAGAGGGAEDEPGRSPSRQQEARAAASFLVGRERLDDDDLDERDGNPCRRGTRAIVLEAAREVGTRRPPARRPTCRGAGTVTRRPAGQHERPPRATRCRRPRPRDLPSARRRPAGGAGPTDHPGRGPRRRVDPLVRSRPPSSPGRPSSCCSSSWPRPGSSPGRTSPRRPGRRPRSSFCRGRSTQLDRAGTPVPRLTRTDPTARAVAPRGNRRTRPPTVSNGQGRGSRRRGGLPGGGRAAPAVAIRAGRDCAAGRARLRPKDVADSHEVSSTQRGPHGFVGAREAAGAAR